ncbi:MAG: hypothetical protein JW768_04280 [Chitinispirillaceae bacterium]|nr:hypothetical protein [Chitinispirillaceae bacterium]
MIFFKWCTSLPAPLSVLLGSALAVSAQSVEQDTASKTFRMPEAVSGIARIEYDLLSYDYPYNAMDQYTFPSMRQSLHLTAGLTQALHYGLARYAFSPQERPAKGYVWSWGLALSEMVLFSLPGGYSWLHEEWHRAILKNRGIQSHNGVYDFKLFRSAIPVSHVTDQDLIDFKRDHPLEMIRLAAAGNESQIELVRLLRKELFFNRTDCSLDWITLLSNTFQAASYVLICSMPYADQVTKEMEKREGASIEKRDVLGMDFTAWVYDLFRPDSAYTVRDTHPSGIGVDRYIKHQELTDDESRYLLLQGMLCWLNAFNPQLFMVNRFEQVNGNKTDTLFWNAGLVHQLTPFGFTVDADVLMKAGKVNLYATLHSFLNRNSYFPGLALGIDDLPLVPGPVPLFASAEIDAWLQPQDLSFTSRTAQSGIAGSFGLKIGLVRNVLLSAAINGKTKGWKAGEVSLNESFGVQAGVSVWYPND